MGHASRNRGVYFEVFGGEDQNSFALNDFWFFYNGNGGFFLVMSDNFSRPSIHMHEIQQENKSMPKIRHSMYRFS